MESCASHRSELADQCPLWVKTRHVQRKKLCPLSANSGHYKKGRSDGGRPLKSLKKFPIYLDIAALAASIFSFTASRLKLAPVCIGGNSIAVIASFSTCCCTNTKRQNSYLNQSKYCCGPSLVALLGQPVRSNGSRRKLVRYGTSGLVLSPSQPPGWSMKRYL